MAFGRLKEILLSDLNIDAESTDKLMENLYAEFPMLSHLKLRIAVNQKIISGNTKLESNDIVALMPPYSGG